MKHIIPLIILFTITCLGQSDPPSGHVNLTFDSGLLTEAPNIMTWENFIENWQGYQSECGESERCYEVYVTGKDTGYAPCTDRIDPGANQAYRGRVTKTIKNKPTFEGFMQFLVKKYRKE